MGGLLGVLTLTACSGGAPETEPAQGTDGGSATSAPAPSPETGGQSSPPEAAPEAPEGLEEFYAQEPAWTACEGGECATLSVPVDYADPGAGSLDLALLRVVAGDQGARQGSLVVNPGGPGGSGVEYAAAADFIVSPEISDAYDIVGFDPRGVASSAPIVCFDDARMDDYLGADPTPDDEAERAASQELLEEFAQACADAAPELIGHVSTVEAARDMDILRAALGEEQMDYLGASYGTFLGTTYATLFPDRVGRFVLDGAIDPRLTLREVGLGQAGGFERATRAYVQDCVDGGDCPLGTDVDSGMARITAFLDEVDAAPLPVEGDAVTELTEGWALLGIIVAMYDESAWPLLTQSMQRAFDGDGSALMTLANLYASRSADGTYSGNSLQAISAVNCLDRPAEDTGVSPEEVLTQYEEVAPTLGRYLAGDGACGVWPAEASEVVEDYSAAGAAPIVVVGTTGDPATPYEWSQALAGLLESGSLVTYEGEGHTAYGRSNDCVDAAVDAYLLEGTVPEADLTC